MQCADLTIESENSGWKPPYMRDPRVWQKRNSTVNNFHTKHKSHFMKSFSSARSSTTILFCRTYCRTRLGALTIALVGHPLPVPGWKQIGQLRNLSMKKANYSYSWNPHLEMISASQGNRSEVLVPRVNSIGAPGRIPWSTGNIRLLLNSFAMPPLFFICGGYSCSRDAHWRSRIKQVNHILLPISLPFAKWTNYTVRC